MTEIDWKFLARQSDRILAETGEIRDRLMVVESKLSVIEISIDSFHRRVDRMIDRIRKLEEA